MLSTFATEESARAIRFFYQNLLYVYMPPCQRNPSDVYMGASQRLAEFNHKGYVSDQKSATHAEFWFLPAPQSLVSIGA
jgi:hypothetical protein